MRVTLASADHVSAVEGIGLYSISDIRHLQAENGKSPEEGAALQADLPVRQSFIAAHVSFLAGYTPFIRLWSISAAYRAEN
jgi:hypothetical protein